MLRWQLELELSESAVTRSGRIGTARTTRLTIVCTSEARLLEELARHLHESEVHHVVIRPIVRRSPAG